jgi:hypothetical protein
MTGLRRAALSKCLISKGILSAIKKDKLFKLELGLNQFTVNLHQQILLALAAWKANL